MPYTEWVHDDYEVKIDYVEELKQQVDDYGYIQRAFGASVEVFALLSQIKRDDLIVELKECATLGEMVCMDVIEVLNDEEEYEEFANYDIENYYPSVAIIAKFDDDSQYELHVCVNQREQSIGYHKRFICILTDEEVKTYSKERM